MPDRVAESRIDGLNSEDVSAREGRVYYDIRFSALVPGGDRSV